MSQAGSEVTITTLFQSVVDDYLAKLKEIEAATAATQANLAQNPLVIPVIFDGAALADQVNVAIASIQAQVTANPIVVSVVAEGGEGGIGSPVSPPMASPISSPSGFNTAAIMAARSTEGSLLSALEKNLGRKLPPEVIERFAANNPALAAELAAGASVAVPEVEESAVEEEVSETEEAAVSSAPIITAQRAVPAAAKSMFGRGMGGMFLRFAAIHSAIRTGMGIAGEIEGASAFDSATDADERLKASEEQQQAMSGFQWGSFGLARPVNWATGKLGLGDNFTDSDEEVNAERREVAAEREHDRLQKELNDRPEFRRPELTHEQEGARAEKEIGRDEATSQALANFDAQNRIDRSKLEYDESHPGLLGESRESYLNRISQDRKHLDILNQDLGQTIGGINDADSDQRQKEKARTDEEISRITKESTERVERIQRGEGTSHIRANEPGFQGEYDAAKQQGADRVADLNREADALKDAKEGTKEYAERQGYLNQALAEGAATTQKLSDIITVHNRQEAERNERTEGQTAVLNLQSQGQFGAAGDLEFDNRQKQERDDLIRSGGNFSDLYKLDQRQKAERSARGYGIEQKGEGYELRQLQTDAYLTGHDSQGEYETMRERFIREEKDVDPKNAQALRNAEAAELQAFAQRQSHPSFSSDAGDWYKQFSLRINDPHNLDAQTLAKIGKDESDLTGGKNLTSDLDKAAKALSDAADKLNRVVDTRWQTLKG